MNVILRCTSKELQKLYRTQTKAKLARRIHCVYLASKGLTCPEIMKITGFARRTIQQLTAGYNKGGIEALKDSPRSGQPTKLSRQQEKAFCKRIEAGPTGKDGVAVLNGPVIRQIAEREFGVVYSLWGIYHLLHRLGYSCICPRPQHEKSSPQAQEDFKKTLSKSWIKSNRSIPTKR